MVLEILDSVWFFSNILSPSSPPPNEKKNTQEVHPTNPTNPNQPPLNTQLLHPQFVEESPNTWANTVGMSEESEQQMPETESYGVSPRYHRVCNMEQKRKTSNKEQSTKRSHKVHKKETKEAKELMCLIATLLKHQPYHSCSMPATSDDSAMKEHLKSWAHAVACTVR